MESYVLRDLNVVNIPKSGSELGPGHHLLILNILKLLKLLTFSKTNQYSFKEGQLMKKNQVERLRYSGGLLGLLFGSSKGKLQSKIEDMNKDGWHLHFIHQESVNLVIWIFRLVLLVITLGLWTIGDSELLIFEKEEAI